MLCVVREWKKRKEGGKERKKERKKEELKKVQKMYVHAKRTIVLVELVQQRAHAVVVELQDAVVQTRQHPGPLRVEGNACVCVCEGRGGMIE